MNNWISVKDRLPEVYKRVLVTDGKLVFEAYRSASTGDWIGWRCLGYEYLYEIIAWQNLPNPPKNTRQ